ncbi:MAG: preprotein translocase subunit SecG [Muribaculaceae bacterium]|nr:preprotein translocase subunit SecG [Muribaculaceae bacterium]
MLYTIIIVLTVIVAILLVGVVLVQKSKGGGLASNFAGSNQVLGVRRTNDFIAKATWVLAGIVAVLSIASVFCSPNANVATGSRMKTQNTVVAGTEYSTERTVQDATDGVIETVTEEGSTTDTVG